MAPPPSPKLREVSREHKPDPAPAPGPVVRAIDVGFGLVKFSLPAAGGVTFSSFPSMAIPADVSAVRSLSTRRRDTYDVPMGGALYEVGRDVGLALAGGSAAHQRGAAAEAAGEAERRGLRPRQVRAADHPSRCRPTCAASRR